MPVVVFGSALAMGGSASAHSSAPRTINPSGILTVTPGKNLVDNQVVTLKESGLGSTPEGLYAALCDPRVVSGSQNPNYCDVVPADGAQEPDDTDGAGTFTFTIHSGADFKGTAKGAECDFGSPAHQCVIVVTNAPVNPTAASFTYVTFKDTRATSKTKLKGKKSAKAKSKVTFKITTTGKGSPKPTGTVVIKDNGKKVAKVKEKNGKATAKFKIKKGKNKLTAAYSGNKVFKPSTAKATIKGK
ncbi:MAG TPA: Ig-like domain repeat protein [Mycobacteriales bacterium]|jgi:hypothetical protein|nr:Ig-like domain repeat protein [Mycobacteriales bacterium]